MGRDLGLAPVLVELLNEGSQSLDQFSCLQSPSLHGAGELLLDLPQHFGFVRLRIAPSMLMLLLG